MLCKRKIGRALIVCLTAASTLLSSCPIFAFSCCCQNAVESHSPVEWDSAASAKVVQEARSCCRSSTHTVDSCSCCREHAHEKTISSSTNSGHGTSKLDNAKPSCGRDADSCHCAAHPDRQATKPATAFGLNNSDNQLENFSSLLFVISTCDLPSQGTIHSCGSERLIHCPSPGDIITDLSRLNC